MDRNKVHPTLFNGNQDDFVVSGNENERLNQMTERNEATMQVPQPSRFNQSKSELSKFNSEIHVSPYSIIERNKLNYVANYSRFEQMRLVENLAGIGPIERKIELLNEFSQLFQELCLYLQTIQITILGINFDEANFNQRFQKQPKDIIETIYKDIKTLESFHIEIVFNSSLRFLWTVLEAQQIEHLMVNLSTIDIRSWQYSCTGHLLKFKVSPQLQREETKKSNTCWQSVFRCCPEEESSQE